MRTIATVAARLNVRAAGLPALIALTDVSRRPDARLLLKALPHGTALLDRTGRRDLGRACRRKGVMLISARRDAGAAALYVRDLPAERARELAAWRRRGGGPVFAAAHSPRALRRAARAGATAALLSPLFPTRSHPGAKGIGITRFRLWARETRLAVYALGGVTAANARALLSTAAVGIAGIDGVP